ncbi:MAG: hypothetical protein KAH15_02510, partial [Candidatus Marinimicrobia bacterium]|nr:hypothetical protein [Candidatus Neomarinimicrobiota bacterium]
MEKLYQKLGFNLVREKLAEYTSTENANLKALSGASFLPKIIYLLKQQQHLEMRDLLALDTPLPLIGFPTQEEIISKGKVNGTVLHEEELYGLAEIMQHTRQVFTYFHHREDKYSELKKLVRIYNPDLKDLEQQLFKLFNSERQIADNASSELFRLRKKINKIDQNIRIKVSHIASKWMDESIASEDVVAFRNGRQVIPIRASRKSKAPGIIHDQSQTGQTVYVEPLVIVEMNNELYQAKQEERIEVRRILLQASGKIREYLPSIELCIEALEIFDLIQAHGKLALKYSLDKPDDKSDKLRIVKGRNLELNFSTDPVPLNMHLPEGK